MSLASSLALTYADPPPLTGAYVDSWLALLSQAAYGNNASLSATLTSAGFSPLSLAGFINGTYASGNAAVSAYTAVVDGQSAVFVAFRGTDDLDTAQGFLSAFAQSSDAATWINTAAYYDQLAQGLAEVDAYAAANNISVVYVTGHSLGGAAAELYMDRHANGATTHYLGAVFGAPGVMRPADIDLAAGFPPLGVQYALDVAAAQASPDPRLTHFEIDEDPATYFGAKEGATFVTIDLDPSRDRADFSLDAFLADPGTSIRYHDAALYSAMARQYDELLLGAVENSTANYLVDVTYPGLQSDGIMALAG